MVSDRRVAGDHGGWIVSRRVLVEPLVRPVVVEVAYVLVEDGLGVSFVVDQHPVGAFGADAADEQRCQASSVAGVTIRWIRSWRGSSRVKADRIARSGEAWSPDGVTPQLRGAG